MSYQKDCLRIVIIIGIVVCFFTYTFHVDISNQTMDECNKIISDIFNGKNPIASIKALPPTQTVRVQDSGTQGFITWSAWIEIISPIFTDEEFNITVWYQFSVGSSPPSFINFTLQAAVLESNSWGDPFNQTSVFSYYVDTPFPYGNWGGNTFKTQLTVPSANLNLTEGGNQAYYLGMYVTVQSNPKYKYGQIYGVKRDITSPIFLETPQDFILYEGETAELNWTAEDTNSYSYQIYKEGQLLVNNTEWEGNSTIFQISDWPEGIWNITAVFNDEWSNSANSSVLVNIVGVAPFISSPEDITYNESDVGYEILWVTSDSHPLSFQIIRNDTILYSGSWDGSNITVNVDYLIKGTYNFTCILKDSWGYISSDTVMVKILDVTKTDITSEQTSTQMTTTTQTETTTKAVSGFKLTIMLILLLRVRFFIQQRKNRN